MFTDKINLNSLDKMDPEYKELLGRVLTIQADCEIGGPHLYVDDMLPGAPTKLEQLIVARTAAEEMDHYRKIAYLAGQIGVDVSHVLSWPNRKRYLDAFRGIIKTWEDFSVFGFLIDRVGKYQLEEFLQCSYVPLQEILPQVLKEEHGHISYGTGKSEELADKGDEEKEKMQAAVDFWYPKALDMFGRSESRRSERLPLLGIEAANQCTGEGRVHERSEPDHRKNGFDCAGSFEGSRLSLSRSRVRLTVSFPGSESVHSPRKSLFRKKFTAHLAQCESLLPVIRDV